MLFRSGARRHRLGSRASRNRVLHRAGGRARRHGEGRKGGHERTVSRHGGNTGKGEDGPSAQAVTDAHPSGAGRSHGKCPSRPFLWSRHRIECRSTTNRRRWSGGGNRRPGGGVCKEGRKRSVGNVGWRSRTSRQHVGCRSRSRQHARHRRFESQGRSDTPRRAVGHRSSTGRGAGSVRARHRSPSPPCASQKPRRRAHHTIHARSRP